MGGDGSGCGVGGDGSGGGGVCGAVSLNTRVTVFR